MGFLKVPFCLSSAQLILVLLALTVPKKPSLNPDNPSSYPPISNLSFISKLVERAVDLRLTEHANLHQLLPIHQSAYRSCHSTETAIVSVHNDTIGIVDKGLVSALVLLDMLSAFYTVDHDILVNVLQWRFGIPGPALEWFADFVTDRSQSVSVVDAKSAACALACAVPQGSVLGPKQFITCTEHVADLFKQHYLRHHQYADDLQTIGHCPASSVRDI
jgi:Reverse transcriptase (RNA-dependent DNA polymerase)